MAQIRLRRDQSANWTSQNPTLAAGEAGYELDTRRIKIGDGATAWNDLAYVRTEFTISDDDSTSESFYSGRTLNVKGSGIITTSLVDDTLTISATSPAQGITFVGDDSTGIRISDGETIKIAGGTGISTSMSSDSTGDVLVISADGTTAVANVLYVSKSGSDSNNGQTLATSFLTIKAALAVATTGTTVFVKSGDYTEANPVTIPAGVALVGDNLRTTTVRPLTTNADLFYMNNKVYVTGFTFRSHVSPGAAFAFNPNGSAGTIVTSPYVQNCSSITTTGTGMRIDGSHAAGLKSMVVDAYTQFNSGGRGVHILNDGYAQLVSLFTICCNIGVLCESGGQCSITNSNTSFGTYGLKADGVGTSLFTGLTNGANQSGTTIIIDGLSSRPAVNDVVKFDGDVNYYTIVSSTAVNSSGESTVELLETVRDAIANNTTATFYKRSLISASGHTFEYVGSGDDLTTALPSGGGVPVQENEIVQANDGQVYYTSTDHKGDFRIGDDLLFNRATGTITGRTFSRSLFAVLTPYILALEGSLNN
jgi:hypothetical protein